MNVSKGTLDRLWRANFENFCEWSKKSFLVFGFQVGRDFGASLPGKLAVLVRGGIFAVHRGRLRKILPMSDAFGRNVGESSAVSSAPLNDTEESSSPRADSTARLRKAERRG